MAIVSIDGRIDGLSSLSGGIDRLRTFSFNCQGSSSVVASPARLRTFSFDCQGSSSVELNPKAIRGIEAYVISGAELTHNLQRRSTPPARTCVVPSDRRIVVKDRS